MKSSLWIRSAVDARRMSIWALTLLAISAVGIEDSSASTGLPVSPTDLSATGAYLHVRPATITYTGDGTGFLGGANVRNRRAGINWTKWTSAIARGTGFNQLDNCNPDCARGTFHGYPVKIELWRPQTLAGTLVFTRMTIFYTRNRPRGEPPHYTLTDTYEHGGFGWGPPTAEDCTHTYGNTPAADCKNIHSLP